jgi:hypothetical protein
MILGSKSRAIPVHQTVELPGKRKLRWEARSIGHRKYNPMADRAVLEWGSLVVGALRNVGTRDGFLLVAGQREHH